MRSVLSFMLNICFMILCFSVIFVPFYFSVFLPFYDRESLLNFYYPSLANALKGTGILLLVSTPH